MRCETLWQVDVRIGDAFDDADVDSGVQPGRHKLFGLYRLAGGHGTALKFAHLVEDVLKLLSIILQRAFSLFHGNVTTADKCSGVTFANGSLAVDDIVHPWLRHRRIVALIMAPAAVADHVDDDIFAEGLPVIHRKLSHPDTGFWIVTIDVEYRCADRFRHVGGILAGPCMLRRRGEANLVVHDHMHGAAGAVPAQ